MLSKYLEYFSEILMQMFLKPVQCTCLLERKYFHFLTVGYVSSWLVPYFFINHVFSLAAFVLHPKLVSSYFSFSSPFLSCHYSIFTNLDYVVHRGLRWDLVDFDTESISFRFWRNQPFLAGHYFFFFRKPVTHIWKFLLIKSLTTLDR